MNHIIRLCYRKLIDANSHKPWDKLVFDSSYREFQMQAQFYDQEKKFAGFSELLQHVPAAEKLHFLVSSSVVGYLQQLNGKIPDLVNNLGRHCLSFKQYRFEIVASDIRDRKAHVVAINFFSEPLRWYETVGNFLLISPADAEETADGRLTDMIALQPFLSIYSLQTDPS